MRFTDERTFTIHLSPRETERGKTTLRKRTVARKRKTILEGFAKLASSNFMQHFPGFCRVHGAKRNAPASRGNGFLACGISLPRAAGALRFAPCTLPTTNLPGAKPKATLGPWRTCYKGLQILMLRRVYSPGAKLARETGHDIQQCN